MSAHKNVYIKIYIIIKGNGVTIIRYLYEYYEGAKNGWQQWQTNGLNGFRKLISGVSGAACDVGVLINGRDKRWGTICSNKILRDRPEIWARDWVSSGIELSRIVLGPSVLFSSGEHGEWRFSCNYHPCHEDDTQSGL